MEDYLDKTIRALIAEIIILEADKPAKNPDVSADASKRTAGNISKLLSAVKALFSPAGFAALAAAGLLVEKDFTVTSLKFALDEVENIGQAMEAAGEGSTTAQKMEIFIDKLSSEHNKDVVKYAEEVDKLVKEETSVTADLVKKILIEYRKVQFNGVIEDPENYSNDIEIYAALISGQDGLAEIYDSDAFALNSENQFVPTKNRSDAVYKKTLNKAILDKIDEASRLAKKEEAAASKTAINDAYRNWGYLKAAEKEGLNQLMALTVLRSLNGTLKDELLVTNFESFGNRLSRAKAKLGDKYKAVEEFFSLFSD